MMIDFIKQIFDLFLETFIPELFIFGWLIILGGIQVIRGRLYTIKKGFVYKTHTRMWEHGVGHINKFEVDQSEGAVKAAYLEGGFIILVGVLVLLVSYFAPPIEKEVVRIMPGLLFLRL